MTELWEKENDDELSELNDAAFELESIAVQSTGARPNGKRGGGVGIFVNSELFSMKKIMVVVPCKLEVTWAMIRPVLTDKTTIFREIIVCGFYSPPKQNRNYPMIRHIIANMTKLLSKYPKAGFVIAGDRNSMQYSDIINALLDAKQLVKQRTHERKTLNIIISNMKERFCDSINLPPIFPDNPETHKASDHTMPLLVPRELRPEDMEIKNIPIIKSVRPLPQSSQDDYIK